MTLSNPGKSYDSGRQEPLDHWPVLIVGAGPVGLLLANLLGNQGIRCLLIEKRANRVDWSRAIGVTPPSLEILGRLALDHLMVAAGVPVTQAFVHDDRRIVGGVDFTELACKHKYILVVPQSVTMRILEEALEHRGDRVSLRRGIEFRGLRQDSAGVTATIRECASGRQRKVRARWIIGCDGHDSDVRSALGLPAGRRPYSTEFVMADYRDQTEWGRAAHLFFTANGAVESFPLPQRQRRWVVQLTGNEGGDVDETVLEAAVSSIAGMSLKGLRISRVFHFVPERSKVSSYAEGRAVLAGDAAHVMSPIGGQGMNTGFADAELLAALLPDLLAGSTVRQNLIRYQQVRGKAAAAATRRAAFGMWLGTRTGRIASALRSAFLRYLLLRRPFVKLLPPHFAMLTIPHNRYRRALPLATNTVPDGACQS